MKEFMDKDFLLSTEIAKELFHGYAEERRSWTTTAISTRRRSQRTESLTTSPRYGWAATIINGD